MGPVDPPMTAPERELFMPSAAGGPVCSVVNSDTVGRGKYTLPLAAACFMDRSEVGHDFH